jgi:hypothetical protein
VWVDPSPRHRWLHALRCVRDRFLLRPTRRRNALAKIHELLFRNIDAEGTDGIVPFRHGRLDGCDSARDCRGCEADRAGCCGGENGPLVGIRHAIHGEAPEFGRFGSCGFVLATRVRDGGSTMIRARAAEPSEKHRLVVAVSPSSGNRHDPEASAVRSLFNHRRVRSYQRMSQVMPSQFPWRMATQTLGAKAVHPF